MRLLFITATRVGDAVLSTGLLKDLIARHPGVRVTVAAGRPAAPLFEALPGLERVLVIDKRRFKLHWLQLWRAVASSRWDLVVDLRASMISYLLLARSRRVIGRETPERHRVEELGALFGLDPPPAPTAWLAARHVAAAERLIPPGAPVLALGPAANWAGKQWSSARFAELARRLTAPGGILENARVAVLAAARERAQVAPVVGALPAERVIDLAGEIDLLTAGACLRRCRLFVGNDSGLMHLAAAAGVPTLGLFGPSPEWRYAPWGPCAAYVRTREPYAELAERRRDAGAASETLMDGLSVSAVAAAVATLLSRQAGAGEAGSGDNRARPVPAPAKDSSAIPL